MQAPVDLTITPIGSAAPIAIASSVTEAHAGGICSLSLRAARIDKSSPGCFLDEQITKSNGALRYPCSGDGPVEADFGEQRYKGSITGGNVELEFKTELDWQDGCRWGTTANISGQLTNKGGVPTLKKLNWRYRDHVITGSACSGVCTAHSTFEVTGKGVKPPVVSDDDDDVDDDN